MSDNFEVGGANQMEFGTTSAYVTSACFQRDNVSKVMNSHRRASARRAFVAKKYFYFFRKCTIVLLNKTLIPQLGSCRAL